MSFVFLFVYFCFLALVVFQKTEKSFIALIMGTIMFPCCALFNESPALSGQIVLLYFFIAKEFLLHTSDFKEAVFKGPLCKCLFFIILSYILTTVFNFSGMNLYYAIRDIIDLYCYFVAAKLASKNLTLPQISKSLYWFVFFMCIYGVIEAFTNTNYLYKMINLAFPAYDGWYNLSGSIGAREGWRIRTIITTKHPTTLGTLLMVLFLFYWNIYQEKTLYYMKNIVILILLGINIILSGSRTSLFCVFMMLLYSYLKTKGVLIKIVIIGAMIFSASSVLTYTIEHFMDNKDGSSIMLRLTQLSFSVDKIKSSPIWGNGSNYTAHQIKDEGVRFNDDNEFIGGLESVVFIYLIDRGLFGIITFYFFWYIAFSYLKKADYMNKTKKIAYEIMPMGIIMFLSISGLIGNNTAFCFLFIGLYIGCIEKIQNNNLILSESINNDIKNKD